MARPPRRAPAGRYADTDGDGLPEGREDRNGNGRVDAGETDHTNRDTDGGSVGDGVEINRGTNPLDPSDDIPPSGPICGDGIRNGTETSESCIADCPLPAEVEGDGDGDGGILVPLPAEPEPEPPVLSIAGSALYAACSSSAGDIALPAMLLGLLVRRRKRSTA